MHVKRRSECAAVALPATLGLLVRDREGLVDSLRSPGFHAIDKGRVKIHSDGDCGVAQSFLHDLRMGSGLDKMRRVSVTELVHLTRSTNLMRPTRPLNAARLARRLHEYRPKSRLTASRRGPAIALPVPLMPACSARLSSAASA